MRHRIILTEEEHQVWLARDARGYRLDTDEGSVRVRLEPAEGPPSSFDKLRMRATETGRATGAADGPVESLTLSLSKGEAFGPATHFRLTVDGVSEPAIIALDGDDIYVHLAGAAWHLRYVDPVRALGEDDAGGGEDVARAPMPGTVVAINVSPGQAVAAGDALLVIESMKLETTIRARHDGAIAAVHVGEGDSFERDAALVSFERGAA